MKIIKLTSENVKKIKAIEIKPSGSTVVIGSKKNGAGKSSVLDSILYAIGGTRGICDDPLRHGAKKGQVVCDLGDMVVKRTFNKSGSTALVVRDNDGTQIGTPQQLLDKITGKIGLDPLEFSRMEPGKQVEVFRELLHLDFTDLDEKRQKLYDKRTQVNKDIKVYAAHIKTPPPDGTPTEKVSVKDITFALQRAAESNRKIEADKAKLASITSEMDANVELIDRLTFKLSELEEKQVSLDREADKVKVKLATSEYVDEKKIIAKMSDIESHNADVSAYETFKLNSELHSKALAKAEKITKDIKKIDEEKEDRLDKADIPIKGITFDEAGIFYNAIPFKQLGSGEQLRISVAMGLAMNPKLKVLLIRDGSLLDKDNLKMIADMADKANAQVWIERVSEGKECTLIIEDGMEASSGQEQEKLF